MFYSSEKSFSRKKIHRKTFVSHTTQEWDNITTLYCANFCSIICQVVAYVRFQTKENFRLLVLKVVAVAYEREVPNIVI